VANVDGPTIRMVSTTGFVSTIAGGGSSNYGFGTNSNFYHPHGIAASTNGHLFVADSSNSHVKVAYLAGDAN
jgi:hypothetical protein